MFKWIRGWCQRRKERMLADLPGTVVRPPAPIKTKPVMLRPRQLLSSEGRPLYEPARDEDFDSTGFAVGLTTGIPINGNPGSLLGAALYQNTSPVLTQDYMPPAPVQCDPPPSYSPAPACDPAPVTIDTTPAPSFDSGNNGGF